MEIKKTLNKYNYILGIVSVLITIQPGWYASEISRKILIVIYSIVHKIFSFFPFPPLTEYGLIDFIFENLIIYTGSSIAFAFVTIFVPILLFEKVFKKQINWKPAIYLLVVWFLFLEFKTGQKILSTEIVGHAAPLVAKIISIIGNFLGLFGTLYYAYQYTNTKN